MYKLRDRVEAGRLLADKLTNYANRNDVIVLALPRGGVPVGYEISKKLHAPLDAFLVRKIGVPWHEELAMGAIAMGGVKVFNQDVVGSIHISEDDIKDVVQREQKELQRRNQVYRAGKPVPNLEHRTVILVDDGLATGATMRAAVSAIKKLKPARIIIAVPVAPLDTYHEFQNLVDEIICLEKPVIFYSISQWYDSFSQTTDEEVCELLQSAQQTPKDEK